MKQLANFPRVERLPEVPGVPKMTGTGWALNGKTTRTAPSPSMLPEPRRGWWTTDYGRPGGLLAFGLNRLRRFRGAASLTPRTG